MTLPLTLRDVVADGGKVFTAGEYNLNIVGIRTPANEAGKFNDMLELWYRVGGAWRCDAYPITTDPGVYYLEHPLRLDGTAILHPGQYRGAYKLGKHRGYSALVQCAPVRVWRDADRNGTVDIKPDDNGTAGNYGINIHASDSDPFDAHDKERGAGGSVGRWSAGCQVFANSSDYRKFMATIEESAARYGDRFTYTLIER